MVDRSPIKRVVVCVDGTWHSPDGHITARDGNSSNVYRIWASIKQGTFVYNDHAVKQVALYEAGVGDDKHPLDRFNDSVTSTGTNDQVNKIFAYCCDQLTDSTDELWMYGYSRGAYVIRTVADLIYQLSALDLSTSCGAAKARDEQPFIHFLGVFDGIKVSRDQTKHDPPFLKTVKTLRYALALNENRKAFQPSIYSPLDLYGRGLNQSAIEAWFVGSHADIGGGPRDDGLSLYPLQWIMLESRANGLILDTNPSGHYEHIAEDPLGLVSPTYVTENTSEPPRLVEPWKFKYINGVEIEMIDLRISHRHGNLQTSKPNVLKKSEKSRVQVPAPQDLKSAAAKSEKKRSGFKGLFSRSKKIVSTPDLREPEVESLVSQDETDSTPSGPRPHIVQINPGAAIMSLFSGPRNVFESGRLVGFLDNVPCGTIIHPSVYFVSDLYDRLGISDPMAPFIDDLIEFRKTKLIRKKNYSLDPWRADVGDIGSFELKTCRVLVCGRAGVGKSTLINKVFGTVVTQESYDDHGVHDVDEGFERDSFPGLIVHDSRGFQSGATDEVELLEKFIQKRSSAKDPSESLDAIWFCIDVPSTRSVHQADKMIFDILDKHAKATPVVLVRTMKDKFINERFGEAREDLEDSGLKAEELDRRARAQAQEQFQKIQEEDINGLEQKLGLEKDFAPFVYVSKRDADSIKELVKTTVALVPDESARRNFVSAQIADVEPKVKQAIEESLRLLNYSNWTSMAGSSVLIGSTISTPTISRVLCTRIVACFGLAQDKDSSSSASVANTAEIERIATRVLWSNMGSFMATNLGSLFGLLGLAAGFTMLSAFGGIPIVASIPFAAIPPAARMVTKCACDLTIILAAAFTRKGKVVTRQDFQDAAAQYCAKPGDGLRAIRWNVHNDISKLIPLVSWKFYEPLSIANMRNEMEKIIQKHRFTLGDVTITEMDTVDSDEEDAENMRDWKHSEDDEAAADARLSRTDEKPSELPDTPKDTQTTANSPENKFKAGNACAAELMGEDAPKTWAFELPGVDGKGRGAEIRRAELPDNHMSSMPVELPSIKYTMVKSETVMSHRYIYVTMNTSRRTRASIH